MERCVVITHRLDMALRLLDTATGHVVSGRGANITVDGKLAHRTEKPDGIMVFQNLPQVPFSLQIQVRGFEPCTLPVTPQALDPALPLVEQHLIPGEGYAGGALLSLEGQCPGIEALCAIKLGVNDCLIREFDPRKRVLTVFNPHKLELDRTQYALVDAENGCFEPFVIVKRLSEQTYKLDRVLELPFRSNFPISPVVLGMVWPDGAYRLRVRGDSKAASWLVRYTVDGRTLQSTVDFRRDQPACLP